MEDCYRVLGVRPASSAAEIKRAFRARAKSLHPDVAGKGGAAGEDNARKMRELISAYETLSDPARRAEFDAVYAQFRRSATGGEAGFDYRLWLMERDDAESRAKLIFFDLLHELEDEAVAEYRAQRARPGGFALSRFFDREDFMDCGFILAEELNARGDAYEAFILLAEVVDLERKRPYFKHFFPEVMAFVRSILRGPLVDSAGDELALECLETALELGLGKKDDAYVLAEMARIYHRMGDGRTAAACLDEALSREPRLAGVSALKRELGVAQK